jgi:hypothetical protein
MAPSTVRAASSFQCGAEFHAQRCSHVDLGHLGGRRAQRQAQEADVVDLIVGDLSGDALRAGETVMSHLCLCAARTAAVMLQPATWRQHMQLSGGSLRTRLAHQDSQS